MSILNIVSALETQLDTVAPIVPAAALSSVGVGAAAVFTTATPHGLLTGTPTQVVGYTGGTPALVGVAYTAKVLSPTTLNLVDSITKLPVCVTIAGTGGSVLAMLTARHNVVYSCAVGMPYQIVQFTPFKPNEPTQGAGFYQETGVFQVTLVYPVGVGLASILTRAELIRSSFKKGSSFLNGAVTVTIPNVPELGKFDAVADSQLLPVKISYLANIFY